MKCKFAYICPISCLNKCQLNDGTIKDPKDCELYSTIIESPNPKMKNVQW